MARKLRIAVSVFFGVLTLLTVAMWVRSYWHADSLTRVESNFVLTRLGMSCGVFFIGAADYNVSPSISPPEITGGWEYQEYDPPGTLVPPWMFQHNADSWVISVPAWFVTLGLFGLAITPFVSTRFSLHTLLIAMTLFAVVLGLAAWVAR